MSEDSVRTRDHREIVRTFIKSRNEAAVAKGLCETWYDKTGKFYTEVIQINDIETEAIIELCVSSGTKTFPADINIKKISRILLKFEEYEKYQVLIIPFEFAYKIGIAPYVKNREHLVSELNKLTLLFKRTGDVTDQDVVQYFESSFRTIDSQFESSILPYKEVYIAKLSELLYSSICLHNL